MSLVKTKSSKKGYIVVFFRHEKGLYVIVRCHSILVHNAMERNAELSKFGNFFAFVH